MFCDYDFVTKNYSILAKKEAEGVAKRNARIKLSNPPSILRKSKQTHEPMETEVYSVPIKTKCNERKYTNKKIHRVKLQGSTVLNVQTVSVLIALLAK
jgi:hypothetical protein